MDFNPLSFALGFGAGTGLSLVAWLSRQQLANLQKSTGERIDSTRELMGRAADERYTRDLLVFLQRRHVAGHLFNLSEVLLEPRLVPPPPPVTPRLDEVEARDIFQVVPLIHDLPYSYAPYNIETMGLVDLTAGDRHIAILGIDGIGKSTTLTTLALMALGVVSFETLEDLTAQAIQEEEGDLTEEQRKQRAREREEMQARALEKTEEAYARQRGLFIARDQDRKTMAEERLALTDLVPILVDLRDLVFDPEAFGRKDNTLDPAEPLIRAVQRQVSGAAARFVGSVLYSVLEAGRALVLLDGYDELSPGARETYFFWLQQFVAQYGANMIVIAGPAEGYDPLMTLGFTPTFLRAWREDEYERLVRRWGEAWAHHSGTHPVSETLQRLTIDNRARPILDVSLKLWTGLADDAREIGRIGWYDALIHRRLSDEALHDVLASLAVSVMEAQQPLPGAELLANLTSEDSADGAKRSKLDDVLDALVADGFLIRLDGDRYTFAHTLLASYLASTMLSSDAPAQVAAVALEPAWQNALTFAAAQIDLLPAIQRRMEVTPDLLFGTLFGLVRWVPDAPPNAPWRGELFRRLGLALLAEQQYPYVRERAMASMVAAREPNVLFIFRQALKSTNPDVRRLGCIGMGALGNEDAINELAAMMGDSDLDVKLAAALALGAIGTEEAIEIMIHGLFQGDPELQRAIAEAMAALPGEGHDTLREAISKGKAEIRRAAVFGLSRVGQPWAISELYRAMFEDTAWLVRNAAEEAFLAAGSPDRIGPEAHPEADTLAWMVEWANARGQSTPAGEASRQILIRVLQEGAPPHKVLAAQTLGRLGHVAGVKSLYAALRDGDESVRGAAYSALAELQMQVGRPLPGLV
jgi:HEAT repeat protein